MFEFAAFTYGVLASFVLASFQSNARADRDHPRMLTWFGWGLMAFSGTLAVLLSGLIVFKTLSGETIL